MTEGYCESVGGVEVLRIEIHTKGLADHAGLIFTLLGLIAACCIAAIVLANRKGK